MIDTKGAERSRRYRAHKRGDHSLCPPDRADCAAVTVTPDVTRRDADTDGPAVRLRARGRRMWDQLISDGDPIEVVVLVEEICRCADRLDRLDAIVNGRDRAWLTLEVDDAGEVTVVVDKVLAEARQQQTTFKALLGELRAIRGTGAKNTGRGRTPQTSGKGGGAGVADLAARIRAKREAAG